MKSHMTSIVDWLDDATCDDEIHIRSANLEVGNKIYLVRWIEAEEDYQVEQVGEVQNK